MSAFLLISFSNLSAVYAPEAMWVMIETRTPVDSRSTASSLSGKLSSLSTTLIFSRLSRSTMAPSSAAEGTSPCAGSTTPATSTPNSWQKVAGTRRGR